MRRIALKMLRGDRAKYLGLIFGVAFATLLMSQQVSIFVGIMARNASAIYSVTEPDLWVMDPRVRYIEEIEPMRQTELYTVRSVPGVHWAVPFYKGVSTIRMPDGLTQQVQLIGVDDVTLVGMCPRMILGEERAIQRPQLAIMDSAGFKFTWPGEPLQRGKAIELNDNRLIVDGICETMSTFLTFPILFVSYTTALELTPPTRNKLPFILVKVAPGEDRATVQKRIESVTGLQVLTQHEFAWRSISYILQRTGIPINFGITITLSVIIGAAITGMTFYIFVIENLKQFGAMKAIGVTNRQLFSMVVSQALLVGTIGYSLGIGVTALFFHLTRNAPALRGFVLYWQVMLGVASVIGLVILISIVASLRKVFRLDPAMVFRG
jgi:putative ABC transport system permease protein